MPAVSQRTVDMTDMIVCNEEIRLLLSKPIPKNAELDPEIGQEVVLTAAVAATDIQIQVEPLQENIKSGTTLTFEPSGASVTLSTNARAKATSININAAAAAIPNYEVAVTDGLEQILTLASAVTAGDRTIALANPLVDWLEKDRVLCFEPSGVEVVVKNKTLAGATSVTIKPAEFDIPAGETVFVKNYLEVCSINQLDDSSSANTLNERNFKSGSGTGKAVTSYNDTITIGGNYIINDFALLRLYNAKQDPSLRGYIIRAFIIEPEGGQSQKAKVWLGQHGNQRPNDQTKKISATLEVDGILEDVVVPDVSLN